MHDDGVCPGRDRGSGASSEPHQCLSPVRLQHPCPCRGMWGLCCPPRLHLRGFQRQPPSAVPQMQERQKLLEQVPSQGGWRRRGCSRQCVLAISSLSLPCHRPAAGPGGLIWVRILHYGGMPPRGAELDPSTPAAATSCATTCPCKKDFQHGDSPAVGREDRMGTAAVRVPIPRDGPHTVLWDVH